MKSTYNRQLSNILLQGLYGPKYVWFFIGWYEDNWFNGRLVKQEKINCTIAQMEEAAEGHFTTEALQWNQDKSPTISGKVTKNTLFSSKYYWEAGIMRIQVEILLVKLQI